MEIRIKVAKSNLSRMIQATLAGEHVVITDQGKPTCTEAYQAKGSPAGYGALGAIAAAGK
jgi:hypothetical protein